MFLELTEILRCPRPHDESYVICGPVTMDGRDVVRGGIICPICGAEYPILDRVAWFGPPADAVNVARAPESELTAEAALALLDLDGPGGYVVTVGAAGRLGEALSALRPGVVVACVNPPADAAPGAACSVLRSPLGFPIRRRSVRAVIVGADAAMEPWLAASVGALLPGLRVVIEDESVEPDGVFALARGAGVLVGERRTA